MKIYQYIKHSLTIYCLTFAAVAANAQTATIQPKLVVNIVISQMRYDYLDRFGENFGESGFKTFREKGTTFSNARYNYMLTNTVAGLATISTGVNPSGHGVISERWTDHITGRPISLIDDLNYQGLDCADSVGRYSPLQLIAATLGDRIKENDIKSKIVSIAASPSSAIVAGGPSADVFWLDEGQGNWISSKYYFDQLPYWVKQYNNAKYYSAFLTQEWAPSLSFETYKNRESTIFDFATPKKSGLKDFLSKVMPKFKKDAERYNIASLLYTPFGNTMTAQFAREAIIQNDLGKDSHIDLLTVCFDSPRLLGEHFGPRSIEVEDMYYRLDKEIGELVNFILAQFKDGEVLITLTSDHGASDTFKEGGRIPMGQFNVHQFKIIMNGFLSAQYEPGNWVVDYSDRQLYLNRDMIYSYGFNLAEVQSKAAIYALQFRGVSGALTSANMQSGSYGSGYNEKIQNSFYPKRSGDVTINLMPGWIEENSEKISTSGSLYEYDTHVPLMMIGAGVPHGVKIERDVYMTDIAPTIARILQITVPNASTGKAIYELNKTKE